MKIQHRAECAVCGCDQAVNSRGQIAHHGYTTRYGYFAGACIGSKEKHFHTPEGRGVAKSFIPRLEEAIKIREDSIQNRNIKIYKQVWERKVDSPYRHDGHYVQVLVENPTESEMDRAIQITQREIENIQRDIEYLEKKIAAWEPKDPREVEIVTQVTVHMLSRRWGFHHKMCAASAMGAQRGMPHLTENPEEVTCPRCQKSLAEIAARKAKKEATQ